MLVRELPAAANVVDYALRLIRATRPGRRDGAAAGARMGALGRGSARGPGAHPRRQGGGAARRTHGPVARRRDGVALPVLRHRLLVNFQAEADGVTPDDVIGKLLAAVRP